MSNCRLLHIGLILFAAGFSASATAGDRSFEVLKRHRAAEATQGVAVDASAFYAVTNRKIAKYDKQTGQRLAEWKADKTRPLTHLNHGVVVKDRLYCAHSNYPGIPVTSSVEIFDTQTLKHVGTHSFGVYEGSLTWIDWRDDAWWAVFAHYSNPKLQTDGRDARWTSLVKFDSRWRRREAWVFPKKVLEKFAPHSCSGGGWGPDGLLYCSGHDRKELYVLRLPKAGSTLELVDVAPVATPGQAFAWDKSQPGVLYGVSRPTKEVVVSKLQTGKGESPAR